MSATEPFTSHRPYSQSELFSRFHQDGGTSKHLLIFYSLVIGLRAKLIIDIGLGQTTGTLRSAAAETGGTVYSYDHDHRRFSHLLAEQDKRWHLTLAPTANALLTAPNAIDLAIHDGAHDYVNVKRDLDLLLPKMRRFGVVCVHDTQQPDLHAGILAAITDATKGFAVSVTNLPFNCGLAILRIEESEHPAISPASGKLNDGRPDTLPVPFTSGPNVERHVSFVTRYLQPAKIKLGHVLRQAGIRK
jgi:hypothetical protein